MGEIEAIYEEGVLRLVKPAKIEAIERGIELSELVEKALRKELEEIVER